MKNTKQDEITTSRESNYLDTNMKAGLSSTEVSERQVLSPPPKPYFCGSETPGGIVS